MLKKFLCTDLAVSLNVAGTGYTALDTLTVVQAGSGEDMELNVDTVGGAGQILTLSIDVDGTDYVPGTGLSVTGGTGAGATIDIDTIKALTGDLQISQQLEDSITIVVFGNAVGGTSLVVEVVVGGIAFAIPNSPFVAHAIEHYHMHVEAIRVTRETVLQSGDTAPGIMIKYRGM